MLDATEVNRYKTRNSPGDEIENVNFPYDDIVHALQNTIDSCINSATDRRGYVLEHMFTTFLCLTSPTEGFAWDDLRKILTGCQRVAKVWWPVSLNPLLKVISLLKQKRYPEF